jgi:hypothetical protein
MTVTMDIQAGFPFILQPFELSVCHRKDNCKTPLWVVPIEDNRMITNSLLVSSNHYTNMEILIFKKLYLCPRCANTEVSGGICMKFVYT